MKKIMLVLGVVALMGGTWLAAGHYYSNTNHVEEVSYEFAQYELDENPFLAELSKPKQTSLIGTAKNYAKAMINPVRGYFSGDEEATFNGAKIIKVGTCSYSSNSSNTDSSSYDSSLNAGSSAYVAPSTSSENSTFSFNDYEIAEPDYLETQPTHRRGGGDTFLFNRSILH